MNIHSILAFTDFSAQGHAALERAARLADEQAATLRIAYLPGADAAPELAVCDLLQALAIQLGQQHSIVVRAILPLTADHLADADSHAAGADLIVMAELPGRAVDALFLRQPLQRLLRQCQRPVLVDKRPALAPYRHVLVAVDFSAHAGSLVDLAQHIAQGELELFHALQPSQDGALAHPEIPLHVVRRWRQAGKADHHAQKG